MANFFYFILITSLWCPYCKTIFNVNSEIKSFLPLNNQVEKNSIKALIMNYLAPKTSNAPLCKCGYNNGNGIEEKEFYNAPKYLFLTLDENENKIAFDLQLNFSSFIKIKNVVKQYELYATINKSTDENSNVQYVCSIRKNGVWKFYNGDSIERSGKECIEMGIPSCIIYKQKDI